MPPAKIDKSAREGLFASTRWTLIRRAVESQPPASESLAALSELCGIYWRPIYIFLRRQGIMEHDAQDLTQGFFADLIENRAYARADKAKGRFRSFLLGAVKHFVSDARKRERALKRGGGEPLLPLDEGTIAQAEAQAARSEGWSADRLYEREWAMALLRQVMQRLENESQLAGKGALFKELRAHLAVETEGGAPYEEIAARLSRPAATLRSEVARLRARYRAILREEIRGTLTEAEDVNEELQHLRQVMAT
jgi:DNA-directed RNA polymerase specialized sigma24 family protein